MKVHDLQPAPGSRKRKIRVGRGTAGRRGKTPEEVTPKGLLNAYNERRRGTHVPHEVA